MLDRLNPDYATLTLEYQQAALLSIAQRGLNLNEDQLMEEAMRVSLKSQELRRKRRMQLKTPKSGR